MARELEFDVGDRVRILGGRWTRQQQAMKGREGVVVGVARALLGNLYRVDAGGDLCGFHAPDLELICKAQDGEHVKLPSGATMVVGAAPKAGEIVGPERMAANLRSLNTPWERTVRERVYAAVHAERERQSEKWPGQWDPGATPPETKLAILVEEAGEIAKEVLESGGKETPHLATELTQLVAVGVAWLESIDGEAKS